MRGEALKDCIGCCSRTRGQLGLLASNISRAETKYLRVSPNTGTLTEPCGSKELRGGRPGNLKSWVQGCCRVQGLGLTTGALQSRGPCLESPIHLFHGYNIWIPNMTN